MVTKTNNSIFRALDAAELKEINGGNAWIAMMPVGGGGLLLPIIQDIVGSLSKEA